MWDIYSYISIWRLFTRYKWLTCRPRQSVCPRLRLFAIYHRLNRLTDFYKILAWLFTTNYRACANLMKSVSESHPSRRKVKKRLSPLPKFFTRVEWNSAQMSISLLSICKLRESRCSEIRILILGVKAFLPALSTLVLGFLEIRQERSADIVVQNFVSFKK